MKNRILFISILLIITFTSCNNASVKTEKKAKDIVLIFKNAPVYNMFIFPSGIRSGSFPPFLLSYIDSSGDLLSGYNPYKAVDTLTIKNIKRNYLEVLYKFQGLEDIFYLFRKGDTIEFTYGRDMYPHVRSYTSEILTKQYNFQANIKNRQVKFGFESFTLLTYEPNRILNKLKVERPNIYKTKLKRMHVDFVSVDTLRKQFQKYILNYQDALDSLFHNNALSDIYYKYYSYLLKRKKAEVSINDYNFANDNNRVQLSALPPGFFNDSLMQYVSYHKFVNIFLYYVLCHEKNVALIKGSNGSSYDTRQVFENVNTLTNIPPKTKNLLRFYCLENIIENFSVEDIHKYLSKYSQLTHDSVKANYLIKKYNLNFKTSNDLLLKNEQGTQLSFKDLLKQYKGKVIYVDFWASWCEPCLRSMPYAKKLREAYKNKSVAFVYLAKNDKENAWKKAIRRSETNYLGENYFIVNSTVSKILEEWKVYSIPRYMIFDKKGNLVYRKAPGPGSEAIRKILNKYLRE